MPAARPAVLRAAVAIAVTLLAAACGSSDPGADAPTTTTATESSDSPTTTPTSTTVSPTSTTSTTLPTETTEDSDAADGTSDASTEDTSSAPVPELPDVPQLGLDGPVCAAYESLFLVGLTAVFAGFEDQILPDLLFTAAMPAIAPVWAEAVAALPADGVSAELDESTRGAAEVFAAVAAEVEAAGVDPALLTAFDSLLSGDVEAGDDAALLELLDEEQRQLLVDVGFSFEEGMAGVPEPDEGELLELCPNLAAALTFETPAVLQTDACVSVPSSALMALFATVQVEAEPYRDDDPSLCSWASGDTELLVSVIPPGLVDLARAGNEDTNPVVVVEGLGDQAWVVSGLTLGQTSDGSGGRSGTGADRSTVGVIAGDTGLLVAVKAPGATDTDELAVDIAELIVEHLGIDAPT